MSAVSKREALDAVNKARTKAQNASERLDGLYAESRSDDPDKTNFELDAARTHYHRCVRELEEAINDAAEYETSGDDA